MDIGGDEEPVGPGKPVFPTRVESKVKTRKGGKCGLEVELGEDDDQKFTRRGGDLEGPN